MVFVLTGFQIVVCDHIGAIWVFAVDFPRLFRCDQRTNGTTDILSPIDCGILSSFLGICHSCVGSEKMFLHFCHNISNVLHSGFSILTALWVLGASSWLLGWIFISEKAFFFFLSKMKITQFWILLDTAMETEKYLWWKTIEIPVLLFLYPLLSFEKIFSWWIGPWSFCTLDAVGLSTFWLYGQLCLFFSLCREAFVQCFLNYCDAGHQWADSKWF